MGELKECFPIPRHPGYFIAEDGNVWSDKKNNNTGGWLIPRYERGYVQVILNRKTSYLHRIMLETFVSPCPQGKESCHNNGIRDDNRIENLRWDTRKNNLLDKVKHGTDNSGERHGGSKLNYKKVNTIRELFSRNCPVTQTRLAKFFVVSQSVISDIKRGIPWQSDVCSRT